MRDIPESSFTVYDDALYGLLTRDDANPLSDVVQDLISVIEPETL